MKSSTKAPKRWEKIGWGACWTVTLAMAGVCLARLVLHDRFLPLIWLNSFTLYLYLPAPVLLVVALRKGRAQLAAVLLVVVVCHLTWVEPDFLQRIEDPIASSKLHSAKLRIFSANVFSRDSYPIAIKRIRETDPDVVLLQEYTHSWRDALERSDLLEIYVHQETLTREGSYGMAVLSKWPLQDARLVQVDVVSAIAATIVCKEASCRLWHVHGPSPRFFSAVPKLNAYWSKIEQQLRAEPGPLIVAGDFNLTQHSHWYARLTDIGLHSAHRDVGRGYASTWPNGTWTFVPPIRIDHILLSNDVRCEQVWEDEDHISDHKPLVADLIVHVKR